MMLAALGRGRHFAFVSIALAQGLVLIRSAVIARALGPEQYGIAATFILLQQFLDATSDTGLNKYVISSAQGHTRSALASVHAISFTRAAVIAVLLPALAYPVFSAFGLAQSLLPFLVLAAAVLCVGLVNYDGYRSQRSSDFLNLSTASLLADMVATAAAVILVRFDQTFMVAIYVILAKAATATLMSMLLARRPYQIRFRKPDLLAVMRYSLPLVANGPLLFFAAQAERLVAASSLSPANFGVYMAVLLLIAAPSQLLLRFLGSIFLPPLSRRVRLQGHHGGGLAVVTGLCAAALAGGFALLGPMLVPVIFGPAYRLDWFIIAIIGLTQALRFARVWSSTLALAHGLTGQVLRANAVRLIVIPACLAGVFLVGGTLGLAVGALAGELLALTFANWAVRSRLAASRIAA